MKRKCYEYKGKLYNINEICKLAGRSRSSFDSLIRKGLTPKQIINTPIISGRKKLYSYNNKMYDIDEVCKIAKRSRSSFDNLIRMGLTPEEIINNKPNYTHHGMSDTKLYYIYNGIINRCYNPKHTYYKDYHDRGIDVCKEWRNNKATFFEWAINNGYRDGLTIDRIDNNKGYSPDNCRWTTNLEQVRNRRNTVHIEYEGVTKTMVQWSEELNIPYHTLYTRYVKGWKSKNILFGKVVK